MVVDRPTSPLPSPSPTLSNISTSSAKPHSSNQPAYPSTGKRSNYRAKIAETLKSRGAEQNLLMKALLQTESAEDDIDLFFKSIAKSVKKLPMAL